MHAISLRQLRVFQAVAESGHFSRAGARVGLTQPAVSRSIAELEAQLGIRLLDRTTREVVLTEAGRGLAARLDRVLDELDQVLLDVKGLATLRQGKVRVASNPTLSAHLMPDCIAACERVHPGIRVVLADKVQRDVLAAVLAGEVDFGVVVDPGEAEGLVVETIGRDPFRLVCRPEHRLARSRSVRWHDLGAERLVLLDATSGSRPLIDAALQAEGIDTREAMALGQPSTVFQMVAAGLGVSVMPSLSTSLAESQGLAVRPLRPQVQRDIALVRRRNRALAPLAEQVWSLIREVAQASGTTLSGSP
jgi:DNA-binding transcriptional LysR family regulator